jgi:hypothetical protein
VLTDGAALRALPHRVVRGRGRPGLSERDVVAVVPADGRPPAPAQPPPRRRLRPPRPGRARVAAALAAGGRLVSDEHAPSWWTLADAEGNEVDVASWLGRD